MTRDTIDHICAALPGATWADPAGGHHGSWTVGGKMFAHIGQHADGVSVKTSSTEIAQLMIEAGDAIRAPYFHKSWVRLPLDADPAFLRERIEASYHIIRAKLPKKVQATLDTH
ncbi:MmcQ/YjbR family DNA-binding protein [Pseudaestuariivita sp.]|uniref:MmcQ/YjbR family DNA-binding protein n=1 Tax=Pseudaestuariivita sp. TaxID=2211669 RepID=UPI00405874DC